MLDRLIRTRIAMAWEEARDRIIRVEVDETAVSIIARAGDRMKLKALDPGEFVIVRDDSDIEIRTELRIRAWAGRTQITRPDNRRLVDETYVDASLVRAVTRAHALVRLAKASPDRTVMLDGIERDVTDSYVRRLSRLAFLAPDIQKAIVEGRQPPAVTLERLMRIDLPAAWSEQRRELGFEAASR